MSQTIEIITPPIAETPLDDMLVELTKAIARRLPEKLSHGLLGGEFGYGADYENALFLMHPYCWCEQTNCPWCYGCTCGHNTWIENPTTPPGKKCDWCSDIYKYADKGAVDPNKWPHRAAPNFWHKPSGLRVWWYKWIGRGMEVKNQPVNLTEIFDKCAASLVNAKVSA